MPKRRGKSAEGASLADMVPVAAKDGRLEAMRKVASGMVGWKPARQVLRKVQAVPTIFTQFDRGTRVGGLPIARVTTIHGPSNEGKTIFSIGLELSFLQNYHFVAHVDAEMTTPITWCEKLMAAYADHPGYLASRPHCFEEVDDNVRRFLNNIGEAKSKGVVPPETSGLVVVDSVKKLVPKDLLKVLLKEGAGKAGMDGMRGRGAMKKAALNAQWLDELVPLLHDTNCALLLIARESEDPEADASDKKYGKDFKIGGGKAIIYDASIVARIKRRSWLYQGSEEEKNVIGERHQVLVWKTKVAGKEDRAVETYFHTSNGALIPEGFDRARDVLEIAREMEVVKTEGSWLHWGNRKWQGENQAVKKLTAEPEVLAELEAKVRGGFVIEGAEPELESA